MEKPATIVFVIGTLDIGGTERQLVQLAARLDRCRFRPIVCCLSSGGLLRAPLEAAGVPVEVVGFRGLTVFRHPLAVCRQLAELARVMRRHRPAIVHSLLFWAYVLGTYAAKATRVPAVLSSRRGLGLFKEERWHYLFLERLANRMTDLIVANSEAVKRDVLRQEKLEPSRVRVIYNGVDSSLYEFPPDPALRASLGIPEQTRIVGVVANLIHYKGHRFFLQACSDVKRKIPEARFLLIGDGPLRGALQSLARDLGLEEEVLFLGIRQDIPQLLSLMDVAVLPSLEEGFPNAVLEAMAAGKPVVATEVGGVPELVVPGKTGLLVSPGDPQGLASAITALLQDAARAQELGRAGRDRVRAEFGLDRMVRETEELYEELLAGKSPAMGRP